MELIELYNNIENPIDNSEVIKKIIAAYKNSYYNSLYSELIKEKEEQIEDQKQEIDSTDADIFYVMLFNKWKNNIITLSEREILNLDYVNIYPEEDIKRVIEYLKTIPDLSTKKEIEETLSSEDEKLNKSFERCNLLAFRDKSSHIYVSSEELTGYRNRESNNDHRLYLNLQLQDIFKIGRYILEKCEERGLSYEYKIIPNDKREDNFVMYSSTENLPKYLKILQEIKEKYPEMISRQKEPPLLTGEINNWIGYGTNPEDDMSSYNSKRTNYIEFVIDRIAALKVLKNMDKKITLEDREISIEDFLSEGGAGMLITKLENIFLYRERREQRMAKRMGKQYSYAELAKKMGYSLEDFQTPEFRKNLETEIRKNIRTMILETYIHGEDGIHLNINDSEQVFFGKEEIKYMMKELSVDLIEPTPETILEIQTGLKDHAFKYGIDPEKFCFDVKVGEKIKKELLRNKKEALPPKKREIFNDLEL